MEFIKEEISAYAEKYTSSEGELLKKLDRETNANVLLPRMLSGHLQGRFLAMISKMIQPKRILEIGTYTGYSALCLAEGLQENGELHTIDLNAELEDMVKDYIKQSGLTDKIIMHVGDANKIIPTLEGPFDIVFIDADKENYSVYYDLIIDKVSAGGYIIADNVLWSGKVLGAEAAMDDETRAIHNFNKLTLNDPKVENILIPIRDGLMVMRKNKV